MKIGKLIFTALFFTLSFISFSQEECGSDQMISRNPFLQQMYDNRVACAPEVDLDTAQVLTIPVVFHIVHLGESIGEGTNISDEQILSCIENLNDRFRANTEALAVLENYQGVAYDEDELSLAIDSKIEFCLSVRDPDGNPTDGIMRYDGSDIVYTSNFSGQTQTIYYAEDGVTSATSGTSLQGVPHTYLKSQWAWPADKYFNCWVVTEIDGNNGGNGIQGFSYVGSLGTGLNGINYGPVCLYNVTGTVGELKWGRELNTTWTHEIGHAFNLYHTFGLFGDNCTGETNPCTQGDQVPDTPQTSTNQSCNSPFCPDAMVENYMDYTQEQCKTAFTQGQIERMREEIWNDLSYLVIDNYSCQPLSGNDLGITSVTLPQSWCTDEVSFSVKINNFGGNDVTGAQISINGVTYPLPPIPGSDFFVLGFTDFSVGDGIFEIEVIYDEDQYTDNNTYYHEIDLAGGSWVEFVITPDVWGNEIEWEITNELEQVLLGEDGYPFNSDTSYTYNTCLPDGCYTFTITDSNGDGICSFDLNGDGICDNGGSFDLTVNGNSILSIEPENADFGSELTFDFCIVNCPEVYCQGDFDGDGSITVTDLLDLLYNIGNVGTCSPYDFDNNGVIGTEDVLQFLPKLGLICGTDEYFKVGSIPLNVIDEIRDLSNINHVILDKQIISTKYYTLRGVEVTYTRSLSNGIYLQETLFSDGTRDVSKIFINE